MWKSLIKFDVMGLVLEKERGKPTTVVEREELERLLDSELLRLTVGNHREELRLAAAQEKAGNTMLAKEHAQKAARIKGCLPGACFQASSFDEHEWIDKRGKNHGMGAWRHQEHVHLSGLYIIDVDHVADPRAQYQQLIARMELEHPDYLERLLAAFVTPSGEGYKLVLKCHAMDWDIGQHQDAFGKLFDIEVDVKNKDASRLAFLVPRADFLKLDDELFTYYNKAYAEKWYAHYHRGAVQTTLFEPAKAAAPTTDREEPAPQQDAQAILDTCYDDVKIGDFIDAYLEGIDLGPTAKKRHPTLLSLAIDLRYLLERNEDQVRTVCKSLPFVQSMMAEGREDEVDKTIADAINFTLKRDMPKKVVQILMKLKGLTMSTDQMVQDFAKFGQKLEEYFDVYPCLREVCQRLTREQYPAGLFVGGALFGTLLTRTWYYFFFDQDEERRLNYSVIVIGDPGVGKSFAHNLYMTILQPIMTVDDVGNSAINQYKHESNVNHTKSDKMKKDGLEPPSTKIRIHGARTSNNVFIDDMNACTEIIGQKLIHLHMFTFDSELDNATENNRGGDYKNKEYLELKAFHNEEDNQQYKNHDSYTGRFNVYWNYVYTGTPLALNRKVNERNFGKGLFSRLAVMPMLGNDYKMPPLCRHKEGGASYKETLRDWAFKLDRVQGELPLWPLVETTYYWQKEMYGLAKIEDSRVRKLLSTRVPYYGLNVAAPFVLMRHFEEWEKSRTLTIDDTDKAFCELIMDIQYYTQEFYFSGYAQKYYDDKNKAEARNCSKSKESHMSMLRSLPECFKVEDVEQQFEITNAYARILISRWTKEELVTAVTKRKKGEKVNYKKL